MELAMLNSALNQIKSVDILFKRIKASLKIGDRQSAAVLLEEMKKKLAMDSSRENDAGIFSLPDFQLYIDQLSAYINMDGCEPVIRLWPCLDDHNSVTPLDPYYFYQDTWAAKMIFQTRPAQVVDIGSTALLVGIVSQLIPTVSVDIRPLPVSLPGLTCKIGSITDLPFNDGSIEFVSSMCVIEHIGLGRYGDPLDSLGSIKAIKEMTRVIKKGGYLLFSVPISHTPRVDFNAHRVFSKAQLLGLLSEFEICEEIFLFPQPGKEEDVARLNMKQFAIWCALCVHH
jgi:SAM-dependent methyltransferase